MQYPSQYPRLTTQAGDTIVEVIIAVAVVATLLVGAFAVSSRSATAVRDSEEHAQALQLLQGQVELLRSAANIRGRLPAALNVPFCLDTSASYLPSTTNPSCLLRGLYRMSITSASAVASVGNTTTFDLTATWPAIRGGTNTVYLSYKVLVTP